MSSLQRCSSRVSEPFVSTDSIILILVLSSLAEVRLRKSSPISLCLYFKDGIRESMSHLSILTDSIILILDLSSLAEVRLRNSLTKVEGSLTLVHRSALGSSRYVSVGVFSGKFPPISSCLHFRDDLRESVSHLRILTDSIILFFLHSLRSVSDGLRESMSHLSILTDSIILILVLSLLDEVRLRSSLTKVEGSLTLVQRSGLGSSRYVPVGVFSGKFQPISLCLHFRDGLRESVSHLRILTDSIILILVLSLLVEVRLRKFSLISSYLHFKDGLRELMSHLPILTDSVIMILVLSSLAEVRLRLDSSSSLVQGLFVRDFLYPLKNIQDDYLEVSSVGEFSEGFHSGEMISSLRFKLCFKAGFKLSNRGDQSLREASSQILVTPVVRRGSSGVEKGKEKE
nr:hypothetical protein [Tanacetum cinerariifolium]